MKKHVQQAVDEQTLRQLADRVRRHLTPDLLKPEYLEGYNPSNPMRGHCFVATESLFHLGGGKQAGLKPMNVQHEGSSHWFLADAAGNIYDITADQFSGPVPYEQARSRGMQGKYPNAPSERSAKLISRVKRSK